MSGSIGWLLNSLGLQGLNAKRSAFILIPAAPALILAAALGGVVAVAWVIAARAVVIFFGLLWYVPRHAQLSFMELWRMLRPLLIACATSWVVAYAVSQGMESVAAPIVVLASSALAGLGVFLATVRVAAPAILPTVTSQIRRTLGRRPLATT
jgi:hypothetical protein